METAMETQTDKAQKIADRLEECKRDLLAHALKAPTNMDDPNCRASAMAFERAAMAYINARRALAGLPPVERAETTCADLVAVADVLLKGKLSGINVILGDYEDGTLELLVNPLDVPVALRQSSLNQT